MREILRRPRYILIAAAAAAAAFVFSVWLPNLGLVFEIAKTSEFSLFEKAAIFFDVTGSIRTNFTLSSAFLTALVSLLFGANAALLSYYFAEKRKLAAASSAAGAAAGVSLGGFLAGLLGVGCASCGTFILTSALLFFGGAGALAVLPLGGKEFGILGVLLLALSLFLISKELKKPPVC